MSRLNVPGHWLLTLLPARMGRSSRWISMPRSCSRTQRKEPAYDVGGQVRPGGWVAELTGLLDLTGWPQGMRVIVRKERPHPGARLRFTDIDEHRFTCFATNAKTGQLADLELRHRRARCEDRVVRRQGHRAAQPPAARL